MSQEKVTQLSQQFGDQCPVCLVVFKKDLSVSSREIHTNKCLDKNNDESNDELLARSLQEETWQEIYQKESTYICTLCFKDLTNANSMDRLLHMNSCADKSVKFQAKFKIKENKSPKNGNQCPLCSKTFNQLNFLLHIKKCAVKRNIPISQLLLIFQKNQESLSTNKIKLSETPLNKCETVKPGINQRDLTKKKLKDDKNHDMKLIKYSAEMKEAIMERALALTNQEVCESSVILEDKKIFKAQRDIGMIPKQSIFMLTDRFMQNNNCKLWELASMPKNKNDATYYIPLLQTNLSTKQKTLSIEDNLQKKHCNEAITDTQHEKLSILVELADETCQSNGFIRESKQNGNLSHLEMLSNDMKLLLEESLFADFIFHCDSNIQVKAHRNILAARSEEFKKITCDCCEVYVSEYSSIAVQFMLKFIYTGFTDVPFEKAFQVQQLSQRYKLTLLYEVCAGILAENCNENDSIEEIVSSFWNDQDKRCWKKNLLTKTPDQNEDEVVGDSSNSDSEIQELHHQFLQLKDRIENIAPINYSKSNITSETVLSSSQSLHDKSLHIVKTIPCENLDLSSNLENISFKSQNISSKNKNDLYVGFQVINKNTSKVKQVESIDISDDEYAPSNNNLYTPKIASYETPLLIDSKSCVGDLLTSTNNLNNSFISFKPCYAVNPRCPTPYNAAKVNVLTSQFFTPGNQTSKINTLGTKTSEVVTPGSYSNFCLFNTFQNENVENDSSTVDLNDPIDSKVTKCSSPLQKFNEAHKISFDKSMSCDNCSITSLHLSDKNNVLASLTPINLKLNSKNESVIFPDGETSNNKTMIKPALSPARKRRKLIDDSNFGKSSSVNPEGTPDEKSKDNFESNVSSILPTHLNNHPNNQETSFNATTSPYYDGDDGGYNSIVFNEKCFHESIETSSTNLQQLINNSLETKNKSNFVEKNNNSKSLSSALSIKSVDQFTQHDSPLTFVVTTKPLSQNTAPKSHCIKTFDNKIEHSSKKKESFKESKSSIEKKSSKENSNERKSTKEKKFSNETKLTKETVTKSKRSLKNASSPEFYGVLTDNNNTINTPVAESYNKFGPGSYIHPETKAIITPMPDYSSFPTPELVAKTRSYALRELPKNKMVAKLKEVYKYQHKFKKWEEEPQNIKGKRVTRRKGHNEVDAASLVKKYNNKKMDLATKKIEMKERLMLFLRADDVLLQKILTYEERSIDFNKKFLLEFLDEQCICYYSKDEVNKWRKKKKAK
ncbi:uncharacterized protein LOC100206903 isoform X4 [Hydra vulgaris]|uniref:Uncharacterized protein LOC100206903 isoform X4 n=1 Tax=Hydra vulgaris TaxID=6087 RepID=A0ABM4D2T1_HYDVU